MKAASSTRNSPAWSDIADAITPGPVLLCNESFSSTNEREGSRSRQMAPAGAAHPRILRHPQYDFAHSRFALGRDDWLFLRAEQRARTELQLQRSHRANRSRGNSYGEEPLRKRFRSASRRLNLRHTVAAGVPGNAGWRHDGLLPARLRPAGIVRPQPPRLARAFGSAPGTTRYSSPSRFADAVARIFRSPRNAALPCGSTRRTCTTKPCSASSFRLPDACPACRFDDLRFARQSAYAARSSLTLPAGSAVPRSFSRGCCPPAPGTAPRFWRALPQGGLEDAAELPRSQPSRRGRAARTRRRPPTLRILPHHAGAQVRSGQRPAAMHARSASTRSPRPPALDRQRPQRRGVRTGGAVCFPAYPTGPRARGRRAGNENDPGGGRTRARPRRLATSQGDRGPDPLARPEDVALRDSRDPRQPPQRQRAQSRQPTRRAPSLPRLQTALAHRALTSPSPGCLNAWRMAGAGTRKTNRQPVHEAFLPAVCLLAPRGGCAPPDGPATRSPAGWVAASALS